MVPSPFEIRAPFHVWSAGCYIHPIMYLKLCPPCGFGLPPCCEILAMGLRHFFHHLLVLFDRPSLRMHLWIQHILLNFIFCSCSVCGKRHYLALIVYNFRGSNKRRKMCYCGQGPDMGKCHPVASRNVPPHPQSAA